MEDNKPLLDQINTVVTVGLVVSESEESSVKISKEIKRRLTMWLQLGWWCARVENISKEDADVKEYAGEVFILLLQ